MAGPLGHATLPTAVFPPSKGELDHSLPDREFEDKQSARDAQPLSGFFNGIRANSDPFEIDRHLMVCDLLHNACVRAWAL